MKPDPEIASTSRKATGQAAKSLLMQRLSNASPTQTPNAGPHIRKVPFDTRIVTVYAVLAVIVISCVVLDLMMSGPLWSLCSRASRRLSAKRLAATSSSSSSSSTLNPATNLQYVKYDETAPAAGSR